eukprot:TRINITY_DN776_c1_g1_i6.p1 TRINITY_DN776_c1_g1~~TRINITY_DN776_c1_g1_i6.p1  ORF type:complete len:201 (+),score=21.29 TRINITY_DN776_c1_g1_i6:124-726(+)
MAAQQNRQTYVCSGCGLMNSFPPGSQLVSCAQCKQVSNVAPAAPSLTIPCTNCRTVLAFPPNTRLANCPLCNAMFNIQTHVLQPGAQMVTGPNVQVYTMYPGGVPPAGGAPPQQQQQQPQPPQSEERSIPPRPTTASTCVAESVTSPKGEQPIEGKTAGPEDDWSSVWQAKPETGDEHLALMQEFETVTQERNAKWGKKK